MEEDKDLQAASQEGWRQDQKQEARFSEENQREDAEIKVSRQADRSVVVHDEAAAQPGETGQDVEDRKVKMDLAEQSLN